MFKNYKQTFFSLLTICLSASCLTACGDGYNAGNRAGTGALIGGGTGAAIGALAGGGRGAAIGALSGGALGAGVGALTTPNRPKYNNYNNGNYYQTQYDQRQPPYHYTPQH